MKKAAVKEMERRETIRLEKTLPVRFALPQRPAGEGPFEALSRNISEGGVFIETDLVQEEGLALDKETTINLEIEFSPGREGIRPRGEIVWISRKLRPPQKKRNGLGIRFIQLSPEEKRALSLFISREIAAQTEIEERELPPILREQRLSERQQRNLAILGAIRDRRLISRAEISKLTAINIVTVSNYIDSYLKKGLVVERGLDISTGGRRPELVEINADYGFVLGIDLGPLNVAPAFMQVVGCDFAARVKVARRQRRVNENIEDSLQTLKGLIGEVLNSTQMERKKIRGMGVGIAGIMDELSGTVRNPLSGSTFANYIGLQKELEEEFSLPVLMENSAACALFAEKWTGVSLEVKEAENILYLYTPQQCAIMINGQLYAGASKSAGQLNLVMPHEPLADRDFCWMDASGDCLLQEGVFDFARLTQSGKEEIIAQGIRLGAKIAYLVNIFNPQVVVIGRNFSPLGDVFLDAVRRAVGRCAFREGASIVRVVGSSLAEEGEALGAATLVIATDFANI